MQATTNMKEVKPAQFNDAKGAFNGEIDANGKRSGKGVNVYSSGWKYDGNEIAEVLYINNIYIYNI